MSEFTGFPIPFLDVSVKVLNFFLVRVESQIEILNLSALVVEGAGGGSADFF